MAPFFTAVETPPPQAHDTAGAHQVNESATAEFAAAGEFARDATCTAPAELDVRAQVLGSDLDLHRPPRITVECVALFLQSRLVFQPGAGYYLGSMTQADSSGPSPYSSIECRSNTGRRHCPARSMLCHPRFEGCWE
jgi:hypothetical protein